MRARVSVALLAGLVALTGCGTVPASSSPVQITQVAEPPGDIGIEALPPVAGASAEEVVRGFVDAMASTTRNHPVARQYLTREAAAGWDDTDGIDVISADYAPVASADGSVTVTAGLVGKVDGAGVFSVGGGQAFTTTFSLVEQDGELRITNPPDGLLQLEPDFARTYDQVNAFFLDPTGTRVVPDPRFLVSGDSQATALVDRLLAGPSTAVAAGVTNPAGGVELRSNVAVDQQVATVDLTGLPTGGADGLNVLCAQLVWSLDQLDDVRAVRVTVDGQLVDLPGVPDVQTVDDWASFDPDAVPAASVGHYVADGALRTVTAGEAAPGPAGTGQYGLVSAAVTADAGTNELGTTVAVSVAGGTSSLLVGPYGGELAPVLTAASFTAPTVSATREEVWTVRDGAEVIRVPTTGSPQTVSATTLPGLGPARVFRLSPDGVRAAVVVDGADGGQLLVGTVVRDDDQVAVRDLRAVAPDLSQVVDVAWRTAASLVVLAGAGDEDGTAPYAVGVDGWGLDPLSTAGLPAQPTAVAAAPSRAVLVVAGGTLWQLVAGTWSTLVRGQGPVAGGSPFYPL
ncbi:LpqB family beta-propeller domain-containing protein [Klenkia taihuensis]|uniref:Sporulation and spore germination n=1 Tax=Klenkia taihuensis TaxID=1225127 RepID=A0A1I1K0Z0_9ACTN|nr:LpqB family beta-propeller domain-containing protein [Klenkia taihuensis]GHE10578.1 lipoprotein LpqB [Klenkia taihuensis]SFC54416.1 Sporulation and spore germination [Klenkia taihuensis]